MQNIKIQNYSLLGYGPHTTISGCHGFGQDILYLLKGCEDAPKMLLQNTHNHLPDYTASKPRPSTNFHHFQHLTSRTKYKEQVTHGWKCHVGKHEILEVQYFSKTPHLIPHSFSTNCVHFFHTSPFKHTGEMKHYNYEYSFWIHHHIR
jgi:hypothetical protein